MNEWDYDYGYSAANLAYGGVADFDRAPYAENTMSTSSISSIRKESFYASSTHQFRPCFAQIAQQGPHVLPRGETADHLDSDPCESSPVTDTSYQFERECELENGLPKEDFSSLPESATAPQLANRFEPPRSVEEDSRPRLILSQMTDMPLRNFPAPSNAPTGNSDAAEHGYEATRPDHRQITEGKVTPSIEAKKEVPSTTNRHIAGSTKLAQACQPVIGTTPEYQSLPTSPRSGELTSTSQKNLAVNAEELMIGVGINGRTMRCLVDTGAAISVLDPRHLADVYDGKLPPLKPSAMDSIRTVSGQPMPIRGVLQTDIEIAGGQYPCDFKVIDELDYKGVLGRDFCYAQQAQISFETLTIVLKNPPTVLFSDALVTVVAPSTYVIPPRSGVVFSARIPEKTTHAVIGLV